jgi:hypothetical protein
LHATVGLVYANDRRPLLLQAYLVNPSGYFESVFETSKAAERMLNQTHANQ